jgi:amino-acid N-acetyltransferase
VRDAGQLDDRDPRDGDGRLGRVLRWMTASIRFGHAGDLDDVVVLLGDAGLLPVGVASLLAEGGVFVAVGSGDRVVGCVALEPAGGQVLVRSLAVAEARRGEGVGSRLLVAVLAVVLPDREVWVLTETAEALLGRHGFTPVDRSSVAGPVAETQLWAAACPASATAMRLGPRVGAA